jgi:hypothetical protein
MKIIEITGIPGSGKSSLLPVIKDFIADMGIRVYDENEILFTSNNSLFRSELMKQSIQFLFPETYKKIAYKLYKIIYRDKSQNDFIVNKLSLISNVIYYTNNRSIPDIDKKRIITWFLWTGGHYHMAHQSNRENSSLIIDEGFAHKVISLFISTYEDKLDYDALKKYIINLPLTDLIFQVK